MSPVLDVQRRMMELGRVRIGGEKQAGKIGKKLDSFRFTSANRQLLESVAEMWGGEVTEWSSADDEGYFQVYTNTATLPIVLPPVYSAADGTPTTSYSQFYELWSGGGCQRRCDGHTEALTGKPCMCNPDDRACSITTRVSFMLPDVPGLGVWRLDSKGWNAALELPGTLEVLIMAAAQNSFVPAVLRIEKRTKKVPGQGIKKFNVPVLDLPDVKIGELLAAGNQGRPLAVNAPAPTRLPRPELPAGPELPDDPSFRNGGDMPGGGDTPGFGEPPVIDDPASLLASRLLDLAPTTAGAITKNKNAHADDPAEHVAWLERQVERAEQKALAGSQFVAPAGATDA